MVREYSLSELVAEFWRLRWLVLACVGLVMLLGFYWTRVAGPGAVVVAYVDPPAMADLAPVNETGLVRVQPQQALLRITRLIQDPELQARAWETMPDAPEAAQRRSLALRFYWPDPDAVYRVDRVRIRLVHPNLETAESYARSLLALAQRQAANQLSEELQIAARSAAASNLERREAIAAQADAGVPGQLAVAQLDARNLYLETLSGVATVAPRLVRHEITRESPRRGPSLPRLLLFSAIAGLALGILATLVVLWARPVD